MSFDDSTMAESGSENQSDKYSNQIELTGNDPTDTNRKRIRVACDNCRRKKIKCNGTFPCTNCLHVHDESNCHYTERPVKKMKYVKEKMVINGKKKKDPQVTTVNKTANKYKSGDVESRLSAIENTLEKMIRIMERQLAKEFRESGGNSRDSSDDEHDSRDSTTVPNYLQSPKKDNMDDMVQLRNWDEFVGTHSITCIFSKDSLSWMESTLGKYGAEYITPIRNLPLVFFSELRPYILKWVDPPVVDKYQRKKLLETPFPADQKLITALIDLYFEETSIVNTIVEESWTRSLFASYFNNFKVQDIRKRRKFKLSELLSMTCILIIALTCRTEGGFDNDSPKYPEQHSAAGAELDNYSLSMFLELQTTLFDGAIYYYHRLSVVSEGIETVEALLLLIICIESNWLTSFFNHIPVAVVIRYAQELGLHRADSYTNLPLKEQERRRRVWWFCYFFDIEYCFKSGKPPMINSSDVTTNSDEDLLQFFKKSNVEAPASAPMSSVFQSIVDQVFSSSSVRSSMGLDILRQIQYGGFVNNPLYFHFSILLLSKIRSSSYHELFVASVQKKSFNEISNTLEKLNGEMMELASHSSEAIKPRFHNDPAFQVFESDNSIARRESILAFKLSYFCHLMIINRYPFMIVTNDSLLDDRVLQYRNLTLDSARTILLLVKHWDKDSSSYLFFNWAVYFPVAAFLVISAAILNHPLLDESQRDLHLLIDIALSCFRSINIWENRTLFTKNKKDTFGNKVVPIELIIRLMLRVVIKVYETKSGITILEGNDDLKKYLDEAQVNFPDIFKNHEEFTSQMVQVVGASPFGSSGDQYTNKRTESSPRSSMGYSAKSPSYNPSLCNIINNDVNTNGVLPPQPMGRNLSTDSTNYQGNRPTSAGQDPPPLANVMLHEYLENDGLLIPFSQFENLPNFFFDNNLGV